MLHFLSVHVIRPFLDLVHMWYSAARQKIYYCSFEESLVGQCRIPDLKDKINWQAVFQFAKLFLRTDKVMTRVKHGGHEKVKAPVLNSFSCALILFVPQTQG